MRKVRCLRRTCGTLALPLPPPTTTRKVRPREKFAIPTQMLGRRATDCSCVGHVKRRKPTRNCRASVVRPALRWWRRGGCARRARALSEQSGECKLALNRAPRQLSSQSSQARCCLRCWRAATFQYDWRRKCQHRRRRRRRFVFVGRARLQRAPFASPPVWPHCKLATSSCDQRRNSNNGQGRPQHHEPVTRKLGFRLVVVVVAGAAIVDDAGRLKTECQSVINRRLGEGESRRKLDKAFIHSSG